MAVSAIVITRPEHVTSLKKRLGGEEIAAVVSEADILQVQDTLLSRPPEILIMHSAFATTSRGATLIAALKAKPSDTATAIRVLIEDELKPLILSETALDPHDALLETTRPLDRAGTRQAARHAMNRRDVAVNGDAGKLIDLSVSGAQVQTSLRLRPLKMVRLVLPDATGDIRLQGTVAWAIAVPSGGAIQYRAGVEFVNPDRKLLEAFVKRNAETPEGKT